MGYTLRAIEEQIGATLAGNGEELISGISTLDGAQPGELAFAEHEKYVPQVRQTRASAVIVSKAFPPIDQKNLLRVANPRAAFVKVMYLFQSSTPSLTGIHETAVIDPGAHLGEGVAIGEHAVIRSGARIGARTLIDSGVHIGSDVVIGEECVIAPNVVIRYGTRIGHRVIIHGGTVIGGDGFGYVWSGGRHVKIPQLGNVVIEDDVELGCNVCVDRATFGSTLIKRGTKVDNLVQIAHNDAIGEDVIMTGQVGLSGSVTIGNRAVLGGKAGVVDHITIGDDARIGAASPVTKDVKAGEVVWGFPARPIDRVKKELASLSLLPKLLKHVRALAQRVDSLERSSSKPPRR
ncbi:MAG: UDP-3-O-(3-hydroxymyristoyl)glucosamine N-acyltransferase [Omnitrophica WOR_2 bacterium RIFCSPLOWO2_02_FULL_63_16]|nr:MAG: UDP-3-O-(3-hydroxymyristoyl)glucosamine N-acyltransferase [Omnitrophica WOR_2 bacterium RIFCSPLOWO2_02_FULL_63_16]